MSGAVRTADARSFAPDLFAFLRELAEHNDREWFKARKDRFEPPAGHTHADVLFRAHRIRVERGDHHIDREHLADAIEDLSSSRPTLSTATS